MGMGTPSSEMFFFLTSFIAVAVGAIVTVHFRRRNRSPVWENAEWRYGGKVERLSIYPAKSCKGIEVVTFQCTKIGASDGVNRDRVFLFVDESGNFITARRFPKLVLIEVVMSRDSVTFKGPNMEDLTIEIPKRNSLQLLVQIWGEKLSATDCGDDISCWISRYLNVDESEAQTIRLVYHSDSSTRRSVKEKNIWPRMFKEDGATFADLAPFLLVNQESVSDLCSRLEDPLSVSARNFRPNILISGPTAFSEDGWSFLKIGEVIFRHTKPCDRCVLTTVDPDKGEKNANNEPLHTLRKYRCTSDPKIKSSVGNSPFMGINLAVEKEGKIKVGDRVEFI